MISPPKILLGLSKEENELGGARGCVGVRGIQVFGGSDDSKI
jgi:hypothetical protein